MAEEVLAQSIQVSKHACQEELARQAVALLKRLLVRARAQPVARSESSVAMVSLQPVVLCTLLQRAVVHRAPVAVCQYALVPQRADQAAHWHWKAEHLAVVRVGPCASLPAVGTAVADLQWFSWQDIPLQLARVEAQPGFSLVRAAKEGL